MTDELIGARERGEQEGAGLDGAPAVVRPRAEDLVRLAAWVVAYGVTIWLGDRTITGDSGFALFWPAAGIAAVWAATSRSRNERLTAVVLVAATAGVMCAALGGSGWQVVAAALGSAVAAHAYAVLARRWAPGLWTHGDPDELETLHQYGALLGAAAVAGLLDTLITLAVLVPAPGRPFEAAAATAVSHTIGMLTLGGAGIVVAGWLGSMPGGGSLVDRLVTGVRRATTPADLVAGAVLALVAAAVFLAGFVWFEQAPVSFVLVMVVVAVSIRFSPPTTAAVATVVVTTACWLSVNGRGPIASLIDPHRRALAFGLFTVAVFVTGLTIALSRRERDATIARLQESERAAEVTADDLRLVLANLEEGVAVIEEGGRFIHANAAIGRLLAMPEFDVEQVQPVDTYQLVHPDGSPLLESEVPHVRAFAGEEEVHDILHLNRPDVPGERVFEVWSRLLPQIRSTDKPRAVTMIRDVTAEHAQRDALTSFAQVVAHDLRNPLTSVELWAKELLECYAEGPVDPETATMMLRHIESASGRMQNFISDLLSYAVARDQTPTPVRIELTDVVESVVETITAVEGVQPKVEYHDLPGVWCDPVLVPQLFDNLIGNARKYVARGVVPQVRIEATPMPDEWAQVRVIDNGIGIAPEDRHRVFENFERAHGTDYDGTGLGLAICRHIVERHGGNIAATSAPDGPGTCIELTLPMTDTAFERAVGHSG